MRSEFVDQVVWCRISWACCRPTVITIVWFLYRVSHHTAVCTWDCTSITDCTHGMFSFIHSVFHRVVNSKWQNDAEICMTSRVRASICIASSLQLTPAFTCSGFWLTRHTLLWKAEITARDFCTHSVLNCFSDWICLPWEATLRCRR